MVLREGRQAAANHGQRITAAIACLIALTGGTADGLPRLLLHLDREGDATIRGRALCVQDISCFIQKAGLTDRDEMQSPKLIEWLGDSLARHEDVEFLDFVEVPVGPKKETLRVNEIRPQLDPTGEGVPARQQTTRADAASDR